MKIIYLFLFLLLCSCHNSNSDDIAHSIIKTTDLSSKFSRDSIPPPPKDRYQVPGRIRPVPPPPPPPPPPPKLNEQSLPKDVFINPEKPAYFSGCENIEDMDVRKKCSDEKIITFIQQNLKYPKMGNSCIEGTAVIRFIIEKDGSMTFNEDLNKVILRDPGCGTGREAVRIAQLMPKWNPASINGKPVRMQFTIPVRFRLSD